VKSEVYRVFLKLLCRFGPQRWWPGIWERGNFRDEVMIGAVLTQGTNWRNVERALKNLERVGITDLKTFYSTPEGELYEILKPAVYVKRKVRTLKDLYGVVYGRDSVPKREELLSVHGIGEETADVILLYAYDVPVVVIDAYTRRWAERYFGKRLKDADLRRLLYGRELFYLKEIHALIDELGKRYCQREPKCAVCPLRGTCLTGASTGG